LHFHEHDTGWASTPAKRNAAPAGRARPPPERFQHRRNPDILDHLETAVIRTVVQLSQGPEVVTWALHGITTVNLLKMSVLVGLLLFVWLAPEGRLNGRAEVAVRGVLGLVLALAVDHAIQLVATQSRPRFALPDQPWPDIDIGWDQLVSPSFPSDHAVLAFALVAIIWGASRQLGLVALAWAVFGISFPRIYFGFHWPTDLIAGGLIGLGGVLAMRRVPLPRASWAWLARLERSSPALATIGLFLVAYECTVSFDSTRRMLKMARDVTRAVGLV
jgi:undecaprenyl-diphosphatase